MHPIFGFLGKKNFLIVERVEYILKFMNGLKISTIFASKYISPSIKFTAVLVRPLVL